MKTAMVALAAASGLLFAAADSGFAQDRGATVRSGKVEDKVKRSLPQRTAPQPAPDARGGTLDAEKNPVVNF